LETTARDIVSDMLDSPPIHKQALEQLAFILNRFTMAAEKSASESIAVENLKPKRGRATKKKTQSDEPEWRWENQTMTVPNTSNKAPKQKTHRLWTITTKWSAFIKCLIFRTVRSTESFQLH
jgi:hypothetical protein